MCSKPFAPLRRRLKKLSMQVMSRLPRSIRDPMVLGRIHADTDSLGDTVVKIAETQAEHEQASRLLFDAYVETDLVPQRGVPVRVTSYLMLPTTVRFVAVVDGEVVATLSLVQDSELGLPLEAAYGDAVKALRAKGERIAEIGALAVKPKHRKHGLTMLLYKLMWKTAVELLDVKHLVVAVRPEVEMFYEATLRFVPLTRISLRYPGINSDSCALHLPLEGAHAEFKRAFANLSPKHFNPYTFFVETQHPQVKLPQSAAELELLRHAHQRAAIRLAWLRPEVVMTLAPDEFKALEDALTTEKH